MSQIMHEIAFPSVMRDKLRSVRWRQAGLSAARAIAIGASVLIAAMIVTMLIDWCFTLFDMRIRILLTTTTLLLSVGSLLIAGVRPVIAAFGWARAAGNVDDSIPVLEERWRTVASFAESGRQPANGIASAMLQQVASEAVALSSLVQPEQVVRSGSLRRPAFSLALACVTLTGFMLVNLPQTFVLMQRFWSPTRNISATQLESVTGDVVVPRGQSIEIVTRMGGLQRASAMLEQLRDFDPELSNHVELRPTPDRPGILSASVDVDHSFSYRVQAGDGRTEWHLVTAIDYPLLSEIRVTVTPPEYVDEPVSEKTLIPGRIRAIQGSQFELAMKPEQELKSLTLVLTDPDAAKAIPKTLTLNRGDDGWYHFETPLVEDFMLSPVLLSRHGLANQNPRVCRIEVIEDKAPVARIISPNEETSARPDETIEIKFEAHDDHGIATAELVVYDSETKEGEEPKILAVKQIPLPDQQFQMHVMGKTELDLKELGLEDGRSISYAVRVTDNRMLKMDPEASGEKSLAQTDADSKSSERMRPSEISGDDPKENDPQYADQESSKANTLITDVGDQPSSADSEVTQVVPAAENAKNSNRDPADGDAKPEDRKMKETAVADAKRGDDARPESEISNTKSQIAADAAGDNKSNDTASNSTNSNSGNLKPDVQKPDDRKPDSAVANSSPSSEPPSKFQMSGQRSDAGQQQETDRQKLKITDRLDALAERDKDQKPLENPVREKVVQIDRMLEAIETKLGVLYKHELDESLRGDGFRELDAKLGDVEGFVSDLNQETQSTAFEFAGLQMIDISSSHVTPARDAVFVAIRKPDSGADVHVEEALHHVVSARELLLALLRKYDSVAQEKELAKKIDEAIRMYTVYVEGSQQLLREAQQTFDPLKLQREMAVVEVDQAYLDRLAEVTRMRRDMMSELARILGDDPRLRSRYLDLIKRRRASLRSQLGELAARQEQSAQEVLGWLNVSENQRENYWLQVSDLRLDLPKALAKEAQQFADRVEKQMPLVLDPSQGNASETIRLAKQIALDARRCDFEVRERRKAGGAAAASTGLNTSANDLVFQIGELAAGLDQLNFDAGGQDGVADYIQLRLAENRALADLADVWAEIAGAIEREQYSALAQSDQQQITIATELLRMEMLNIESDLAGQFNEENPMPQEIINLTQDLLRVTESLTFNQSSAAFGFSVDRIEPAAAQQELALKGFEEAGRILDQLRRKTVEALDKEEVPDPNIAELIDPTLDEFLARLEREPDIEAQLGIPNRPRNIRVLQDAMQWQQNAGQLLGAAGEAAMTRVQQQMKQQLNVNGGEQKKPDQEPADARQMSDEEKKQLAESGDMQQMLKDQMRLTLKELEERANDSSQSDAQRRRMNELAQRMSKALEEMKEGQNPEQLWRRMVEAEQARAALEALAKGETLPDDQWNKLMSTLDDGLGQVGGRTPPEDYRKAIEQYQDRIRQLTGGTGGDE